VGEKSLLDSAKIELESVKLNWDESMLAKNVSILNIRLFARVDVLLRSVVVMNMSKPGFGFVTVLCNPSCIPDTLG
jgi:hypothetical protein